MATTKIVEEVVKAEGDLISAAKQQAKSETTQTSKIIKEEFDSFNIATDSQAFKEFENVWVSLCKRLKEYLDTFTVKDMSPEDLSKLLRLMEIGQQWRIMCVSLAGLDKYKFPTEFK